MKKIVVGLLIVISSISSFASVQKTGRIKISTRVGVVTDAEFREIGVSQKNIDAVKKLIEEASLNYKRKTLDRRAYEIEINKYMLEGTEKNIKEVNELIEKISILDAEIIKDKLRYQIEVQKYITTEEYIRARDLSIKKLNESKNNNNN